MFCYRICNGTCFVYTLSIYEVTVKQFECTCEDERHFTESQNISYWRKEEDNEKWPKCPTTPLIYKRIGKSPHCIYALVHESYVNASSLALGDQHKFPYQYCQCDIIFANYAQKVKNKKRRGKPFNEEPMFEVCGTKKVRL